MNDIARFHVGNRLSDVAVYNGTVYLAGQVPTDGARDIRGQAEEVLSTVEKLLEEVGSHKSRILSATIYLADMDDFGGMNEIWDAWVAEGNAPPRATVQAKLARPDWRIEIVVVAAQAS